MKSEASSKNTSNWPQATFAGGCFWCLQGPFDFEEAVTDVRVGYVGGSEETADYYTVASGGSEHREGIIMRYDPDRISYEKLLEIFWRQIDPTDTGGQFADRGRQYTTAIYYHTEEQRLAAENSREILEASGKFDEEIATVVEPFTHFFEAEDEHQGFYKKNPVRYKMYARGSGRSAYIKNTWSEKSTD